MAKHESIGRPEIFLGYFDCVFAMLSSNVGNLKNRDYCCCWHRFLTVHSTPPRLTHNNRGNGQANPPFTMIADPTFLT